MDKFGSLAKNGWKPSGDKPIHRETWKQDLKGIATRKKSDPNEEARNHQSAPLSSLRDPDSFGPPPKHSAYYGPQANSPTTTANPTLATASQSGRSSSAMSGLGAPVPPARPKRVEQPVEEPAKPPEPYRVNTTGLRTDNLPKPPIRSGIRVASPASHASPALPPRVPPRQVQGQAGPPPILPPRQNEYPDEYAPAPPPPYAEATRQPPVDIAAINQSAVHRLGQAGVSVPTFGIGQSSTPIPQSPARGPQLNELQQRFARLNTSTSTSPQAAAISSPAAAAAQKKPPPPPPKKKPTLTRPPEQGVPDQAPRPPPIPLSSKPNSS